MTNLLIALFAYLIDKIFGEFTFMVHPLSYVKEMSRYFKEEHFKESVLRGLLHLTFVISIVSFFIIAITLFLALTPPVVNIVASSFIAAMFLSNNSAKRALHVLFKRKKNRESFIHLVKYNTGVKKVNDSLIAPLFYLLLFGLIGIVIYKSINVITHEIAANRQEPNLYAKSAKLLNDGLNFLPSSFIAILILLKDWR